MRAGSLDRKITIERAAEGLDAYGVPQTVWTAITELRAHILRGATEEAMRPHGASTETVTTFRTRYFPGITLADRVVYAGHAHDITEVREIGRRRGLELRTIARGLE